MRPRTAGRYLVGDKALPSLGAALTYGQSLAERRTEPGTMYVRVLGEEGAAAVITRDEKGVVYTRRLP